MPDGGAFHLNGGMVDAEGIADSLNSLLQNLLAIAAVLHQDMAAERIQPGGYGPNVKVMDISNPIQTL
ncbi:hypothetical protein D3C81_2236510 [compost metagenome]